MSNLQSPPLHTIHNVDDLLAWLERQPSTIGTHTAFRHAARSLTVSQPEHAALLILLVGLSKRFTTFFEDVPMTVPIADTAQHKLAQLFRLGLSAKKGNSKENIKILNQIATGNLLETRSAGAESIIDIG